MDAAESFAELFFMVVGSLRPDDGVTFSWLLWSLWRLRNLKLWESKTESTFQVLERATRAKEDWWAARNHNQRLASATSHLLHSSWRKPPLRRLKCNMDVAFFNESNMTALGMCLRNDLVEFVMARTKWFSPLDLVHEGEAQGLLQAIKWAIELDLDHVSFELDCKVVVDHTMSNGEDASEFGAIISHCKQLIALKQNFTVEFVGRQGNVVAYKLARMGGGYYYAQPPYFFYSIPTCIEFPITIEMK